MRFHPPPVPRADSCLLSVPMATRPSTAAILAAARARDGKRADSPPPASPTVASPPAKPKGDASRSPTSASAPVFEASATPSAGNETTSEGLPAQNGHALAPASVAAILGKIRAGRELAVAEVAPPSIGDILAKVREATGGATSAPPSIGRLLDEVRRLSGTTKTLPAVPPAAVTRGVDASSPKRRPDTAAVLAAARKQGSGSTPSVGSTPRPTGASSRTADILAAARRQGASAAQGSSAPKPTSPKPSAAPRPTKAESPGPTRGQRDTPDADSEVRPKPVAEILAAVRSGASAAGETSVDLTLPPLAEMVSALRRLDSRLSTPRLNAAEPVGWAGRLRRWFGGDPSTHRRASI